MEFPKRIYTTEEVKKAGELVKKGYKHRLMVKGSLSFKQKVKQALKLVKTAGYYNSLRTYLAAFFPASSPVLVTSSTKLWT